MDEGTVIMCSSMEFISTIELGTKPIALRLNQGVVITSVYLDEFFALMGDNQGLLTLVQVGDGRRLRKLNQPKGIDLKVLYLFSTIIFSTNVRTTQTTLATVWTIESIASRKLGG
jgi:hypothetical protein